MNKALGYYGVSLVCSVAGIFLAFKGDRELRKAIKAHEADVWDKADRDPHSTTDVQAELASEVKAPAQGFGFNGVSER